MTVYKFYFDGTRVCVKPITVLEKGSLLFTGKNQCEIIKDFNVLLNNNTMYSKTNTKKDIKLFVNALIQKESDEITEMQKLISDKSKRVKFLKTQRPKETVFMYNIVLTKPSSQIIQCSATKTELVSVDNDSVYTVITKTPFGELHKDVLKEQFGKLHFCGYPQGYVCYLEKEDDAYFAELCAKTLSLPDNIALIIKEQLSKTE